MCVSRAKQLGMSEDFIREIFTAVHRESVRQQVEIMGNNSPATL